MIMAITKTVIKVDYITVLNKAFHR